MTLTPISILCPQCGSAEVFYSCNPTCCYNHVCNKCYTTFELDTTRVGEVADPFEIPADPESGAPTAPCARCHEPRVFTIAGSTGKYVCVACRALLSLEFTEISPA